MASRSFSGGKVLEDRLREISQNLNRAGSVKVGFLEGALYPDGTPVAMIAAIQDWGAPSVGIPPRPFFRNMVRDKSPGWGDAIAKLVVANNYDTEKILALVGEGIASQLRQSIRDTNDPPLAEATIKRKGFDKPLIDTSHMFNSVDYEVKTKE